LEIGMVRRGGSEGFTAFFHAGSTYGFRNETPTGTGASYPYGRRNLFLKQ